MDRIGCGEELREFVAPQQKIAWVAFFHHSRSSQHDHSIDSHRQLAAMRDEDRRAATHDRAIALDDVTF